MPRAILSLSMTYHELRWAQIPCLEKNRGPIFRERPKKQPTIFFGWMKNTSSNFFGFGQKLCLQLEEENRRRLGEVKLSFDRFSKLWSWLKRKSAVSRRWVIILKNCLLRREETRYWNRKAAGRNGCWLLQVLLAWVWIPALLWGEETFGSFPSSWALSTLSKRVALRSSSP